MKLGFIGLGNMGGPMARHLLDAGHDLTVHDVRQEAASPLLEGGARWASSPREVAHGSEVVFTSLPGPTEVAAVALGDEGIGAGAHPGLVYVDMSTNSPTVTRRLHATLAERGVAMLDAPVSGGVEGARAGTLAILVGGDQALYERLGSVLDLMGRQHMYCGPIGCGQIAKLVNNYIALAVPTLVMEALTMGVKAGADPAVLYHAVVRSTGNTSQMERKFPGYVLRGNFQPGFMVKLAHKDMRLALELAQEYQVPVRLGSVAFQELVEAMERGYGDLDICAAGLLQEARSGVEVRAAVEPPLP